MKKIFVLIVLLQLSSYSLANTWMYKKDGINVTAPHKGWIYLYHNDKLQSALRLSEKNYFNIQEHKNGFIITKLCNTMRTKTCIKTKTRKPDVLFEIVTYKYIRTDNGAYTFIGSVRNDILKQLETPA